MNRHHGWGWLTSFEGMGFMIVAFHALLALGAAFALGWWWSQ